MSDVAIRTDGLTRRFGEHLALDDLSIEVPAGEVLALLGPNGAGKTTTVRLLNGVLAPHAGSMRVLGLDPVAEPDGLRRHTGVLTEHAGLDDRLTATENLLAVARIRGMDDGAARRRIGELLERFGMSARADVRVAGASTGQRKRIALARSLLHEPDVLFLDEPTSGLDPAAIRDVVHMIDTLAAEQGRTIILCTHFLGEADELADRMAVLHRGRLEAYGRPGDLAAELFDGVPVTIEFDGITADAASRSVRAIRGVREVSGVEGALEVLVTDRAVSAHIVAELVHAGANVYAARPHTHSLSDVYFEVERRRGTPPPPPPPPPASGQDVEREVRQ